MSEKAVMRTLSLDANCKNQIFLKFKENVSISQSPGQVTEVLEILNLKGLPPNDNWI